MKTHAPNKIIKNFSYSFFGYVFPLVFTILVTPLIVRRLGVRDYGILLLINTITGFLSLMDFGVGMAFIKRMAEFVAKENEIEQGIVLASARSVFLLLGGLGLCVFLLLGGFFLSYFHVASEDYSYVFRAFVYSGISYAIISATYVCLYALQSVQRYDLTVRMSLLQTTCIGLLNVLLVWYGFGLHGLLLANISVSLLVLGLYVWHVKVTFPTLSLSISWNMQEIRGFYKNGVKFFITNISNNTLAQFDRLIIPLYLTPMQLTYYSLPGNVAEKINGVTASTTNALFPLLASLQAVEDFERVRIIYKRVIRSVVVLASAMTIPAILFAGPILHYWLGPVFAQEGRTILVILAVTNFFLALYGVLQNFLSGYGKISQLMRWSASMAVINLVLLLILVPRFGIEGAAWAYLCAVLPVAGFIYWTERVILVLPDRPQFYLFLIGKIALTTSVFWCIHQFLLKYMVDSLASLIVVGPLSVMLFLGLYSLFGFLEVEDRELVKSSIIKMRTAIRGILPSM